MELRTKKILLSIGFVIVVFLIGYLLYYLFFKPTAVPTGDEIYQPPTGEFPEAGPSTGITTVEPGPRAGLPGAEGVEGKPKIQPTPTAVGTVTKVTSVVNKPTKDPVLAKNGKDIAYYDSSDNRFYKVGADGQIQQLSDKKFFNVKKTYWSKDINKAVIEYPDSSKVAYDFNTQQQYTIPKHWEGFDFSPDSNQIVTKSMGVDPDNRWLAVSNIDGSQSKRLEPLGENGAWVNPAWSPTGQIVATYVKGTDLNRQEVFFIGQNGENFKSAMVEGRGFESAWSPTGSHLLYSVYNGESDYKPTLWITEADGESIGRGRRPLEINTWSHKCTFSSATKLYCAVPIDLQEGSGLFPEVANDVPDNLYEIDLSTGTKKLIAIPEQDATMKNIIVSNDNQSLYYTDVNSGEIFQIKL